MNYASTIVIKHETKGFWTGTSWSGEYPDAKLYTSLSKAVRVITELHGDTSKVSVFANYGLENQMEFAR